MGNYKRKFIFVFTTLISVLFLNNLDVNAANEGDVFNVGINGSTLRTTNSLYINQGNVTFNLSNSYVYQDVTLVPQYGVVAYCSGVGKQIENFYGTNISNVSLYNTGMPCSIYGKEDGYSNEQLVYVTFTLAYSSGIASGVNCSAQGTNCYFSGMSFTIYNPSTDEISLKHAYLTNTLPDIQMNPNGSVLRDIASQNDAIINNGNATNNKLDEQIEQNKEIINQQKETNDYITDDTEPNADISALGNVQGLLPEGPVDSLLNIPFMFLSVITSSMGGVCVPMEFNFVFDSSLTLPCFSEQFYGNVPDLLLNFLSLIPSAFILIKYFKHLYKKVDRAVSMDSNADDQWGAI